MNKIKLAIIGNGFIVERFLESIHQVKDFELIAFYYRNSDTAKKFQDKYDIKYIYTDLDEMANNDEIDAVYIAYPNSLYYSQTIKFLNNKNMSYVKKFLHLILKK